MHCLHVRKSTITGLLRAGVLLLGFALLPVQGFSQVSGISYTLSPSGEHVFFDRDAASGLDGGFLYGGELGLGFGQYLELSGEYLLGQDYTTQFAASAEDPAFDALLEFDGRSVDMQRYGARLRVNVGSGALVPFVTAGAGVLQFDPDGLETSQNIFATLGVGLAYTVADRYSIMVSGQQMGYRYNPGTAFYSDAELQEAGLSGGIGQRNVRIPSLRAALSLNLGGRAPGQMTALDRALLDQFGRDGTGVRLFVEPFYGRIEFNEALGFPKNQNMAGANVGMELGPYVGLRGFYWRGTTGEEGPFDDFAGGFENIALYGGELNLRFGNRLGQQGLVPYAILGGGYMDVLSGYEEDIPPATLPPDDQYFATVGAGVELPLTRSLKLQGDVRSLLMSTEDPADVTSPESVYGNWMYSAGLEFNLGGGGAPDPRPMPDPRLQEREATTEAEIRRLQARLDSLQRLARQRGMPIEDQTLAELRQQVEALERRVDPDAPVEEQAPAARRTNLSGETITLPIPEVGEIYIRVGELGAEGQPGVAAEGQLTREAIRSIVRDVVRQEVAQAEADGGGLTTDQVEQIVQQTLRQEMQQAEVSAADVTLQQLQRRLEEEVQDRQALERELSQLRRQLAERRQNVPNVIVGTEDGTRTIVGGQQMRGVLPITGFRFGDGPTQLMLAVRGDLRQPGGWVRLLPELGVGVGGGRSANAFVTAAVPLGGGLVRPVEPYVGAGLGVITNDGLSGLRVGVNLMGGVEYRTQYGTVFGEFSTFNFLNTNRLLVGYRFRL